MTLGADLTMLAVNPQRGAVRLPVQLGFALAGSELVDLAVRGRLEATADGLLRVADPELVGDPVLDAALINLAEFCEAGRGADEWVNDSGPERVDVYVAALVESGELRARTRRLGGQAAQTQHSRLRPADKDRRGVLGAELLAAAADDADLYQQAFGALAHAADIPTDVLRRYPEAAAVLAQRARRFLNTRLPEPPGPAPDDSAPDDDGDGPAAEPEPKQLSAEDARRLAIGLAVAAAVEIATNLTSSSRLTTTRRLSLRWG
ncbi:MAG TPA: GPP34 family phosphoprotein [Actinocrinis sp.]